MTFAVTSSSSTAISCPHFPFSSASSELKASQIGSVRLLERSHGQSSALNISQRKSAVKPLNAEPKRNDMIVPFAATAIAPEVEEKEKVEAEDYEQLAKDLENASPLEIMDKALEKFGNDIAIAFSGAEDVVLIEYAHLTGRPFRVFSLDTGRLNLETYRFFDAVEKHYGIRIEYMFPDAVEVQALVRSKGLFSFYEDGHQECCRVRKVRPLRRALKGLRAWITGQRKDQSPGTRSEIHVVQVDPVFEGLDGGIGSLVKWNPVANVNGVDIWNFLRTMDVPVNSLHLQGYISIGCEPCTRPVLPGQHEREGRWWWEDAKAKECGLHKGNIMNNDAANAATLDEQDAVLLYVDSSCDCWVIDSGASFHTTAHRDVLENYVPGNFGKVSLADGGRLDIVGMGEVSLKTPNGSVWKIYKVRHVPKLMGNLISVGQLDDEGHHVTFNCGGWKVTKGAMVVACGSKIGTLYASCNCRDTVALVHTAVNTEQWHHRLRHMSERDEGASFCGKFRADGEQKGYDKAELQLQSFPTILFFLEHSAQPIKYSSENSLMAAVNALR